MKTSGAYVLYRGLFPFQVGPTKEGNQLGVVRLGGHRENNEDALETAKREVYEESSMKITPINSPVTYFKTEWNKEPTKIQVNDVLSPVLIKGERSLSVMYLSYSETEPEPSSETDGILLLTPNDVHLICNNEMTLGDYLGENRLAKIKSDLNKNLILKPYPQLLFLSKLLKEKPLFIKNWLKYVL